MASQIQLRDHIGTRHIGKKLCLINQPKREAWICGGVSKHIWGHLQKGDAPSSIASALSNKFNVPEHKVASDIDRFIEQLWMRCIVDLPGKGDISDAERRAMVGEESHDKSKKVFAAATEAQVLARVWLDLLIPCNLRCRHCYLDFSKKDILPFEDVCNFIDQLADHGCPEVILTGGEIFLRKDILDIIAYVEQKGFLFSLYTNGIFIDREVADQLSRHFPYNIQISVYGTSAEIHEKITRKAGTFEKSTGAARLLIERNIPVQFAYHIQQDNFDDAFNFPDFAQSMGARHEFDSKLVPNRNGSTEPLTYGVTIRQQAELYSRGLIKQPSTSILCTAAMSKARINAHGDIYPCELINTAVVGNLKQMSLAEIWNSRQRTALREDILAYKPKRCGHCSHVPECVPCAAMRGYNQERHMEAPVSEACMLTTADLLSKGKTLGQSSPFRIIENDCITTVAGDQKHQMIDHTLVQILDLRPAQQ